MGETKHTPGPWEANGSMIDHLTPEGNLVTVASVNCCWHKLGDAGANAALIAAAPEMYAALVDAERTIDALLPGAIPAVRGAAESKLALVRAALKKARGE